MRLVAALEVAEPAGGPGVVEVPLLDQVLDHLVLARRLDRDEVHAHLPAEVARVQPARLVTLEKKSKSCV